MTLVGTFKGHTWTSCVLAHYEWTRAKGILIHESWAPWTAPEAHNTELDTTKEGYLLPTLALPTQPAIVMVLLA